MQKTTNFTYEIIKQSKIGILTLSNAQKRNSLSIQLIKDLHEHLQKLSTKTYQNEDYVKVIIIKSLGSVFSAGHDLKEMKNLQQSQKLDQQKEMFLNAGKMAQFMQTMPQITIAQVHNFATAAGCQLVCSCDQVVASKSAKFSTPGIKIGLFCSTPGVALIRSMSHQKKAFEMLVTGDPISAQEAFQYGLVNKLVENDDDIEAETLKLAEQITVHSGEVLALGKKAFYQQKNMENLGQAYDLCAGIMSENLQKEDCIEGLTAFMEKRHAHFKK